jgi:hypothetical protein
MPDFYEFIMRHGEFGAQDLIERVESYSGIKSDPSLPLEERWITAMQLPRTPEQQPLYARA